MDILINKYVCPNCLSSVDLDNGESINDVFTVDRLKEETYCKHCGLVVKDPSITTIATLEYLIEKDNQFKTTELYEKQKKRKQFVDSYDVALFDRAIRSREERKEAEERTIVREKWEVITLAGKRGRPKNKTLEELLPEFETDEDLIDYLAFQSLKINVVMVESSLKTNNIKEKNLAVRRAKVYERKATIDGLKATISMIKDKNILELKRKFDSFEFGLIENNDEASFELQNLRNEFEKIKQN